MYLSGMFNAVDTQTSSLCHATVHKKKVYQFGTALFLTLFCNTSFTNSSQH